MLLDRQSPRSPFTLKLSVSSFMSQPRQWNTSLSLAPVIINVCCPGKEGGGVSHRPPVALARSPHTALLALTAACSLGGKISWSEERERRGDHSSDILVFNAPLSLALALGGGNERSLFKDFSHQILKNGCNFLQFLANCRAQVRSPKVRSPKVKTKGTWADTKITRLA